jgi:glycerol kinase
VGFWKDVGEIGRQWQADRRFRPAMTASERRRRMADWTRALDRSRRWAAR